METAIALAAAGVLAFLISVAITPIVIMVSHRRQWFDVPNARKIHNGRIPRIGGIGIFFGLLVSALAVPLLLPMFLPGSRSMPYTTGFIPVFASFCLIHVSGLTDDFYNLNALFKFLLQIAAAALVTVGGFTISTIKIPGLAVYSLGIFAYPLTVIWIVAISNAMNLVDGVDGLAGGIAGISALALGTMSLLQGRPIPAIIAFCLLGAVVGFLAFNFPPARVFMGDSGSLFLGFVLAVIPLLGAPGTTSFGSIFAPATVLLIPILDTISAIVRRAHAKRPIYSADNQHVHHKLLGLKLKVPSLLLIIYGSCICLGICAVASTFLSRGMAAILLGAIWLLGLLAFGFLTSMSQRRKPVPASLERHP